MLNVHGIGEVKFERYGQAFLEKIEEIENGIHYTKLYDVWRAIIEIVQKEDVKMP